MFKLDLQIKEYLKEYHSKTIDTRQFISMEDVKVNITGYEYKTDIKRILHEHMSHVKIDSNLVRDIEYFLKSFVNRNEEHINFFGSNLTGVNKITFSTEDRNQLCVDLLGVDEFLIKKQIKALPHIGDNWIRGTDGLNLSLLYLCHQIHNSKLSDKDKQKTIVNCLIILQIKFLSSLLHGYFKYPVSEKLALAVYDALSRRFYIKKYGTWFKILEARAINIYTKGEIHFPVIESFEPDAKIQYMITDIQTRIKAMILAIYDVTVRLKDKGVGLSSQAMLVEQYGKIEVRDIEKNFNTYLIYIQDTMQDERAFIKPELIEIISDSITTMPAKLLSDLLIVISRMAKEDDKKLNEMTREIMIYLFDYLRANKRKADDLSNLGNLIIALKQLFTASKTNNSGVFKLRDYFDNLVKKNIKNKNPATITGVRTGIVLYIILRTLTKNHYE